MLLISSGLNATPADTSQTPPTQTILNPDSTIAYWIVRPDVFSALELSWRMEPMYQQELAKRDSLIAQYDSVRVLTDSLLSQAAHQAEMQTRLFLQTRAELEDALAPSWWENNDQYVFGILGVVATLFLVR